MNRNRSRLIVEIDLDPVPGWGNRPEDHVKLVQSLLARSVDHYHPSVRLDEADAPAGVDEEGWARTVFPAKAGEATVAMEDVLPAPDLTSPVIHRVPDPQWKLNPDAPPLRFTTGTNQTSPAADAEHVHVCVTCAQVWNGERWVQA